MPLKHTFLIAVLMTLVVIVLNSLFSFGSILGVSFGIIFATLALARIYETREPRMHRFVPNMFWGAAFAFIAFWGIAPHVTFLEALGAGIAIGLMLLLVFSADPWSRLAERSH